jgi:serine/threonine protein kinase
MIGTDGYLAPEVFKKYTNKEAKVEDLPKTDLWSFGVTLYQIASGSHPFMPVSGVKDRATMGHMINKKPANAI